MRFFYIIVLWSQNLLQLAVFNNRVLEHVSVQDVLSNYWQCRAHQRESNFGSLHSIADKIEEDMQTANSPNLVERVKTFCSHLQREDHFDDELHQMNLTSLENDFKRNNNAPESISASSRMCS